jgi:membrane associated rhomboid family serine protease
MAMNEYRSSYSGYGNVPPVVTTLLLTNAAIFLLGLLGHLDFSRLFGLVPVLVWSKFFVWQLFTYMFLHGGFWHIFMNMFILWMFGSDLEREWGSREFFKFYIICGMGAAIFNVALQPNSPIPIVGASGAIYGLLVAYAMMYPNRTVYIYFLFPVPVKYMVIGLAAIEFVSSMASNSSTIAHFAHLGGMLVGFIYLKSDWRIAGLKSRITTFFFKKKIEKQWQDRAKEEKLMEEVDQILDKINKVGYDKLTRQEKKTLEDASQRLSKK